jgi:hypothetical protein
LRISILCYDTHSKNVVLRRDVPSRTLVDCLTITDANLS